MFRPKTLSILAGITAVLAFSAIPASAEFKSTMKPPQSQGNITVINSGVFEDEKVPIKCVEKEIKGQYHIQTKGQIKEHEVGNKQKQATEGPHLIIQIKSWGKCKAVVTGLGVPAEVKACDFQLVQRTSVGQKAAEPLVATASGGVLTTCLLKIGIKTAEPICELQIPPGMETAKESDQGINVGLEETKLENSGANILATVSVTKGGTGQLGKGVRVEVVGGKKECPLTTNENGKLTELKAELLGVNVS